MNYPVEFYETQLPFQEISHFIENYKRRRCIIYASDLVAYANEEFEEVEPTIQRVLSILKTLNIPVEEHFYPVFRTSSFKTYKDWKISRLAGAYFLLNGSPENKSVAALQAKLIHLMKENL